MAFWNEIVPKVTELVKNEETGHKEKGLKDEL